MADQRMLLSCPYCPRDDLKSARGLEQHISRTTACRIARFEAHKVTISDRHEGDSASLDHLARRSRSTREGKSEGDLNDVNSNQEDVNDTNQFDIPDQDDSSLDLSYDYTSSTEDWTDSEDELVPIDQDPLAKHYDSDATEESIEPNHQMLKDFQEYCELAQDFAPLTAEQVTCIRLLDLLKRKKTSLNAYQEVLEWHLKAAGVIRRHEGLAEAPGYQGRETLMKYLAKRYNMDMETKFPKRKKIRLPSSKAVVTIVYHEVTDCLVSLLTDPRVQADDYIFFNDDPLQEPPDSSPVVGELNTGKAYQASYEALIEEDNDVLCPVPMYIDGTATGQFSYLPVTQLKVTLGIFNRKARDKEYAWRSLGYVAQVHEERGRGKKLFKDSLHLAAHDETLHAGEGDQREDDGEESVEQVDSDEEAHSIKAQDFHTMLRHILEPYLMLQKSGFLWDLVHHNRIAMGITMKLFVPYVKCDTEEADILCGKYTCRTSNVKHVCRYCHCPMQKADDPRAKYRYKTQHEIESLVLKGKLDRLRNISQQNIKNAFYPVRFHHANERGIHGACPSEMLHALLLGLFKYTRDIFFKYMGETSQLARDINGLAQLYGKMLSHQSDRSMPYTNFTKGIQKGKLMAKKYRGVLLIMAAVLRSTEGRAHLYKKKKFNKKDGLSDWIILVETLLEWEAYLCEPNMKRVDLIRLAKKHRIILYIMKTVAKRSKGMGLKLMKFHAVLHLVEDILLFGVPGEFDTGSNESHHKPTKAAAKLTQRRELNYDYQTAVRLDEFLVIELAMEEVAMGRCVWNYFDRVRDPKDVDSRGSDSDSHSTTDKSLPSNNDASAMDEDTQPSGDDSEEEEEIITGGAMIRVYLDEKQEPSFHMHQSRSKHKNKTSWDTGVVKFLCDLQKKVSDFVFGKKLAIYTEHVRGDKLFRGHPNFRGGGSWRDWAIVDWGPGYGKLPTNIWCFVDLRSLNTNQMARKIEHGGVKLEKAVYAVVEAAEFEQDEEEVVQSDLFTPLTLEVESTDPESGAVASRKFYLANTEAFVGTCCVIPDVGGYCNAYFLVQSRNEWPDTFVKWLNQPHKYDDIPESEDET